MSGADVRVFAESPVPPDVLERADTLVAALSEMVEHFPDFECLTFYDRKGREDSVSLASFFGRAQQIQSSLWGLGLAPGGCGIVILPTSMELVSAYFGVLLAGGTATVVAPPSHRVADPSVYARHVGAILANARADVLYTDETVAAALRADAQPLGRTRILTPADVAPCASPPSPVPGRPDDIATIQYSSGSTGAPKGVMLSHAAILDNLRSIRTRLELGPRDVGVNWIPLHHDMGLIDAFLLPLLCGCPTVLVPTMDFMREPALWLRAIHRYRGSLSWGPTMAYNLCATRIPDEELDGIDLSCWRTAIVGAEPVLAQTLRAFSRRFARYGLPETALTPFYGLAENVTAVCGGAPAEPARVEVIERKALVVDEVARPTRGDGIDSVGCGAPIPGNRVEIRDSRQRALAERCVGTIWVRSNSLFSGYRGDPEATRIALRDGWLDTGDRGYLADGQLFFVSREKDLIVIGGEKYAPHEVEAAIDSVPGVRTGCAVAFGVLNRERGTEELAAVVETRETDAAARESLSRAIREQVARSTGLGVRHLKLVPAGGIEKTTSGKVARRATRERYHGEFAGEA